MAHGAVLFPITIIRCLGCFGRAPGQGSRPEERTALNTGNVCGRWCRTLFQHPQLCTAELVMHASLASIVHGITMNTNKACCKDTKQSQSPVVFMVKSRVIEDEALQHCYTESQCGRSSSGLVLLSLFAPFFDIARRHGCAHRAHGL